MDSRKLEEELAQRLMEGDTEKENSGEAARKRLPARTEIRIPAQIDPIAEETRRYREMADEVDGRYARYDRPMNENKDEPS